MGKREIRMGFVTANAEIIRKLDILRNEYGVSLNDFFVKTIAEKLRKLGCSFDDKSFTEKPMRKIAEKTQADRAWDEMQKLQKSFMQIQMRKK